MDKGLPPTQKKYVVRGYVDPTDGVTLYWSNEDGWVDRDNATRFAHADLLLYGLPLEGVGWEVA